MVTQLAIPTNGLYSRDDVFTRAGELIAWGKISDLGTKERRGRGKVTLQRSLTLTNVISVSTCMYTLVVTEQGLVYTFGDNRYAQLSLDTSSVVDTPTIIEHFRGTKIIKAVVGGMHSLALSDQGQVFMWGIAPTMDFRTFRNLHLDVANHAHKPTTIDLNGFVVDIHSGVHHCFAQLQDGRVIAWGRNDIGQCGLGNRFSQDHPQEVHALENMPNLIISAGGYHTLALRGKIKFEITKCSYDRGWLYNELGNG
jgi:alpha-tubulin suppressor-like RCC1 family protein